MELREEAQRIANEIAEEALNLINKKLESINSKIRSIDKRLSIVAVEDMREITERYENISIENDETITRLIGEIQELRDEINSIKSDKVKNL